MEQKSQQTDQQATNAALAALAAAGNSFALGQLWELNQGFLHRLFWQWYSKNKTTADAHGLTLEGFDQEAFFAVQAAAQAYDPEKGRFLTLLSYYVQNQINKVVCGERGRYISTEDGRQVRISANPLDDCTSFDAPLDAGDDGSGTRGDLIEDPAASQAFQKSEDEIYTEELHTALEEAMAQNLTVREAHILRRRYYDCQSLRAVGNELGVQRETIRQIERRCIRKLRELPKLQRWHDDIISTRAWRGTGLDAWKHNGSVQERTVEYLEAQNSEQYFALLEEAAQLAPEHRATIEEMKAAYYARLEQDGYYDCHPEKRPDAVAVE